jgi:putative transposase
VAPLRTPAPDSHGARPATWQVVAFIDEHRDLQTAGLVWRVEPICEVLQVAPSTYCAARSRPPSARAVRDAVTMPILLALWTANYRVYGARKLWKAARRAGHDVSRDQTARLMRLMAICVVIRRRRVTTTRRDEQADRHPDRATASSPRTGPTPCGSRT